MVYLQIIININLFIFNYLVNYDTCNFMFNICSSFLNNTLHIFILSNQPIRAENKN